MKTKTLKKNKVNVVTLGCSKNIYDSEVLMAQLKANQFDVEHESMDDDASVVIINTCGFIDNAKQESIDMIIQYVDAKSEGLVEKVFVTGCLSTARAVAAPLAPAPQHNCVAVPNYNTRSRLPRFLLTRIQHLLKLAHSFEFHQQSEPEQPQCIVAPANPFCMFTNFVSSPKILPSLVSTF